MADTEQIRTQSPAPFSTWVGVVLLFALFGAIVVAVVGPSPRGDTYEQMRAEARAKKLKDARDEDAKALTTYAWVDKNKGTVRLPIDRAMELTVADLANKNPAPAYAITAPESSAAPGGAAAATPAPTADIPLKEPVISAAASDTEQLERARIDASTRVPVLMFYASAMVWLLIGTLLAGFVSFKLHSPDWLSDVSFLTWGRLRPVHMNVMVYGWASMAAMGTAIWLMARLWRTNLYYTMVFARRVSLVPVALRGRASDALRGPGPRRDAGSGRLVVRE